MNGIKIKSSNFLTIIEFLAEQKKTEEKITNYFVDNYGKVNFFLSFWIVCNIDLCKPVKGSPEWKCIRSNYLCTPGLESPKTSQENGHQLVSQEILCSLLTGIKIKEVILKGNQWSHLLRKQHIPAEWEINILQ